MHIYLILSLIGTFILFYTLWVLTTTLNIKFTSINYLSIIFGLVFLGCATYLSCVSPSYLLFHGGLVSLFIMLFSVDDQSILRKLFNGALAFLLWPQFVCLIIFVFYYANRMGNE